MRRTIFGIAMAIAVSAACAQPAQNTRPVDLRDLMSVTQFHQAGLDKLSPQELTALNAWLDGYLRQHAQAITTPELPAVPAANTQQAPAAAFGSEQLPEQGAQQIESRIDGVLKGWTGNTLFKLENGQVWKQAGPGYETNMRLDHPQVVIKKLAFGYLLTLTGRRESVFVRRVQ
ncbi:MAG TPA: hypothetical protein VFX47_05665 [Gammaproteobacteria bacterium]|nr:hypothetical protein [Gammaproteobacteria bacterium]